MDERSPSAAPFKGLTPYGEDDAAYFYGRESECEIITANLLAARLTILYGASGVGKSSVLRAGVAYHLRRLSHENVVEFGAPKLAVVVYDSWRDDPIAGLRERMRASVAQAWNGRPIAPAPPQASLAATVQAWSERVDGTLLIILDQFEEYFLYHAHEDGAGTFAAELPSVVNRPDLRVSLLIALREDAVAKLDRFKGRIPHLFDNYLRIEHLDYAAARAAVERPVAYYNRVHASDSIQVAIESALVDEVLAQVRTGRVTLDNAGRGVVGDDETGDESRARVETPYLQLVMARLWEEEMRAASWTLRLAMLEDLGGATSIVRTHLDMAMDALPTADQDVAARIFRYLVTPSGTKIAYSVADLATYADLPQARLVPVLEQLSGGATRILRPLAPPPDQPSTPRYEIFHDVLAPAILDWRARYAREQQEREERARQQARLQQAWDVAAEQQRQAESERRRAEEQALTARRLRRRSILLAILSIVALGAAAVAVVAQGEVQRSRQAAVTALDIAKGQARLATSGALAMQSQAHLGAQFDVALLLATEATNHANTVVARGSLLKALESDTRLVMYLNGQPAPIARVAFSGRSKIVVSVGQDGTIVLWDSATGRRLGAPFTTRTQGSSMTIDRNGSTLAIGGSDGTLHLWDLKTRRRTDLPAQGRHAGITTLAFSDDGKTLASGDASKAIALWNVARAVRLGPPLVWHGSDVTSLAFSPDGKTLASGSSLGVVYLWDVATERHLGKPITGHNDIVFALAFSPDGQTLASAGEDRVIRLWDVASRQRLGQWLVGHAAPVTRVVFSPDGDTLASCSADGTVRLWNLDRQIGPPLTGHTGAVNDVAFSADGRFLVSGGDDTRAIVWAIADQERLGQVLVRRAGALHTAAFSTDGKTLAFAGDHGAIWLWDTATRTSAIMPQIGRTGRVWSVAFSPDGKTLASGSTDGLIRLWDLTTHRPLGAPLSGHRGIVTRVAFSPNGKTLASSSADGTVRLWDVTRRRPLGAPLHGHTNRVWSIAFSPTGKLLASSSWDRTVRLWDVATHKQVGAPFEGHTLAVFDVTFSPGGKTLASASWDTTIRLWDVATHRLIGSPLTGYTGSVVSVRFSPDGRLLASGGHDKTVVLWDITNTPRIGLPLTGLSDEVWSIAFSPDGHTLAFVGPDGTAQTRTLTLQAWKRRACGIVGRNLTRAEWNVYVGRDNYQRTCPELPAGD